MSSLIEAQPPAAPDSLKELRQFLRWVTTNNPFYVISAGLFLIGLRVSFGSQVRDIDTWALMAGLAGYTLLLAVTAWFLIRVAAVWDDARTVLLVVVLMFLATSVTFDEVLVLDPVRGTICYLGGLLFTIVVSEALVRGCRLRLPVLYRVPYYLILTVFFLYPLALSPLLETPKSEAIQWGVFGFATCGGLVFLTLLPAIRRGQAYIRDNGSPWEWPLYPWTLFAVLGIAVPYRAFLICWSMHLVHADTLDQLIFGPYFLVPFGLAITVLLLEGGLTSRRRDVQAIALILPVLLVMLSMVGHRPTLVYQEFLRTFSERLGGTPLYLTLLATAGFYTYALVRRVSLSGEALTAALLALAVVGPRTLTPTDLTSFQLLPGLAAATLMLCLGVWRRDAIRCLLGAGGLVAVVALVGPETGLWRWVLAYHLLALSLLVIGAVFAQAVVLRHVGAALILIGSVVVISGQVHPATVPYWAVILYPMIMAAVLVLYGRWLGHRLSLIAAGLIAAAWVGEGALRGYGMIRQVVTGLDYLTLSLAVFGVAILISLAKGDRLPRWFTPRPLEAPPE